jgi:periplasmic copper chaperone A
MERVRTLARWQRRRTSPVALAAGLAVAAVLVLVAPGTDSGASYHGAPHPTAAVGNRIGSLRVVDAFLPEPPSPAVAAIYLTVKNTGSRADALVGVSSAAASSSLLMTENPDGTMGLLPDLPIPAHSEASLVPGRDHLMLEQPHQALRLGHHVLVTLHFRRAGSLTISVPVVPLSAILEHGRT